jgi:serine/threonine protein kinase/tetratricopeptide (TPR) repeat protein
MDSDRWKQVDSLLQAVLERPPEERDALLRQACADDANLEREVRSLLASQQAGSFLDSPAIQVFANLLADSAARTAVGTALGPYQIESRLGAGGMGEVYKARDTRLNRWVAVKVSKEQFSERFAQEARAIAALNHPNICTVHDVGPNYLVLEYIDGKPLQGPVPAPEAVRLATQIASALEEAHGRGILHRDLKPANILVTAKGTAKLLDFGLAKLTAGPDPDLTKTVEGAVLGTAAYMSPEQAQGKPLDERSDIFSFGAVLYELLSGHRAFSGDSMVDVLSAVVRDDPRALPSSPEIVRLVMRCLRKAPSERFQSMAEVRAALEAISAKPADDQPSIAVLPFANMSRDPDDEYFSDGLAEEIINLLAHIPGLSVTARTSSFAFRGKEQDITKIAESLRVCTILEGSVRRAGSRIRVTVQLIKASDGYHLWSERYDREMTDVFAMQDDIAAAVAGALRVKLTGKPATARPHEPNLPAYEAFLKGVHQIQRISPEAYARAEEYFKQAIALDPHWAAPHSALGLQYHTVGFFGLRPLNEMVPLARAEARKALELFPSEPEAHRVLGAIAAMYEYDWKEAEEQFRLARATEPIPPGVRIAYALYCLAPLGHFEEALQEQAKAIAQDPLNATWRTLRAGTFFFAGMYERAIAEAREALELGDRSHVPHVLIAQSHFFQGRFAKARESAEEGFRLAPWDAVATGFLAYVLMQAGEKDRARELLARLLPGMMASGMVRYLLVSSEIDAALDWYEKGIEERQSFAVLWASAEFLQPLRASPRWPKLAKMMNLPERLDTGN